MTKRKQDFIAECLKSCYNCEKSPMVLNKKLEGDFNPPFQNWLYCPNCHQLIGIDPEIDWEKCFGVKHVTVRSDKNRQMREILL